MSSFKNASSRFWLSSNSFRAASCCWAAMTSEMSVQALTIARRPSSASTTLPLSSVQNHVPSFFGMR